MAKKKAATKVAKAYHHGDLRHALLAAARAELAEVGRDHLSLRSVARRAQVSHTAAYHHFADKAALLSVVAGEGFVALDVAMREEMAAVGPGAIEQLVACGRGYLKMAAADPTAYELMFNDRGLDPSIVFCDGRPDPFARLHAAVDAARQHANTSIGDTMTDAMVLWEVVHGCAMLTFSGALQRMGLTPATHVETMLARTCAAMFTR
jgi:AcrR family transcriptional regulator